MTLEEFLRNRWTQDKYTFSITDDLLIFNVGSIGKSINTHYVLSIRHAADLSLFRDLLGKRKIIVIGNIDERTKFVPIYTGE